MLNEFIEMFLGAYYNFVPEDYAMRDYFTSIIVVMAEGGAISGAIITVSVSLHAMFKVFKK